MKKGKPALAIVYRTISRLCEATPYLKSHMLVAKTAIAYCASAV